jgi:hypothetical protein
VSAAAAATVVGCCALVVSVLAVTVAILAISAHLRGRRPLPDSPRPESIGRRPRPGHRDHSRCSIYAPCRAADLKQSWEAFTRAIDDPATRHAVMRAELQRMAEGRDLDGRRHLN